MRAAGRMLNWLVEDSHLGCSHPCGIFGGRSTFTKL